MAMLLPVLGNSTFLLPLPLAGEGKGEGGYNANIPLTAALQHPASVKYTLRCRTLSSPLWGEEIIQ
jgi:hypothetical protein